MAPKRGGRWAEMGGGSSHPLLPLFPPPPGPPDDDDGFVVVVVEEDLSSAEKGFKIPLALSADAEPAGNEAASDRSQMESSARPWATLARRPTVQTMVESSVSSRTASWEGSRWEART